MQHIEARCAVSGHAHSALTFERSPRTAQRFGAWRCHCEDCFRLRGEAEVGTGRDQSEALSEYARACKVPVSQLEQTGEQHV